MFASNTTESALIFVFKNCPPSTQTFSHTFRQGNALAQRTRKSSPLLVLMESVPFDFHDCFTKDFTSKK